MKNLSILLILLNLGLRLQAQYVYTIKADSVKITNCDSAELILENHTQNISGFLFNTGNGRTIFKRGVQKLNDSMFVIGADTMKLPPSWTQGGNAFGAPGVLGTKDNQPLNLYTNGLQRGSLTAAGNLLLGSGTDNGNLLQVNGNASIGSATIAQNGNLYGTNAILFNHFTPRFHNYGINSPFISRLEDVLYNYNSRLHTTSTQNSDGSISMDFVFPADELTTNMGIVYGNGRMYFSFWPNGIPQSISVTAVNYQGGTAGPYTSSTNISVGAGLFEVDVNMPNWLTELRVTIYPQPGGAINLQDVAYVLDADNEGLTNPYPYVSKYQDEHIYNYFYLKNGGVDNVRLSPVLGTPNYFMNAIGIGTMNPTAQLHTSGSVRFAGLTQDNTQTQIIVADSNGNLFYRSASSLAAGDLVRPSLAVNGPITAQRLRLKQMDWADYVFDSSYQLPRLAEVESYIRREHHLPGIPSAAAVQKDSLDVGASQSALLKKIEELTLYTIDQDKKLNEQSKKLTNQDQKLADQDRQLSVLKAELEELKAVIKQRTN